MYQFEKIKLIIWDLDDTFWRGTLSEGSTLIPDENRKLVKDLTDAGIINSICSKNDWQAVKAELEKENMIDYFVFPSVNWESKGNRIKKIVSDMQLRSANVLFLDDNHSNREEAVFYCNDIMTGSPEDIPRLISDVSSMEKKDMSHKRLAQYHVLESKSAEKQQYSSNEDFLCSSDIRLEICFDCKEYLDRIHELILRSNQLNFTKIRSSFEELSQLIENRNIQTAYVKVSDKFGDYGIVGFYALHNNKLIHFVFSCRTLGMGIEQYVYNSLGRPDLDINGEVISDLSYKGLPKWINQENRHAHKAENLQISGLKEHMVLIKGPCDLYQIYPYISNTELFDTDFSHTTNDGVLVESTSHTTHIVESNRLTEEQKSLVDREVAFVSKDIYNDSIFRNDYKVVIISILTDANFGVYQRKNTGEKFAVLEYIHPITDEKNWDKLISGEYFNGGFRFNKEILSRFSEQYEFIGRNSSEQLIENLKYIRENLNMDCLLCVMLGGELYYEKNTIEAYKDRHIIHKQMNDAVREWAQNCDNVKLIDVNKYLVDQSSFYDHFNHYIKPVYYALAKEIVDIVNEKLGSNIKETSRFKMVQIRVKEMLAPTYHRIKKQLGIK